MKKNIHPKYSKISVNCSCSNVIEIFSTLTQNLTLDVCSKCHPFYTGKQRIVDTSGRVEKFHKRFTSLVR
ncbi:50S ribosomal subunit protein L31 [Buchnera aphidicola (Nipponaphis monzeni)]|uniref:Large ribosomal subunit protein bL31 n=1 Tax=Buchnera aphidicola (Nipponaphis monzeni) TaxID=2495405 RepID=A0A455TAT3_9GAMM|nr:50S ribosomal protein L31 [Buchnera aphidicola]BBI01435.1 50S ribosomal subunit protein L31 [Buchnera aphidicola (Nipponaphis monzeni)]